jgi:hypothetical protein
VAEEGRRDGRQRPRNESLDLYELAVDEIFRRRGWLGVDSSLGVEPVEGDDG